MIGYRESRAGVSLSTESIVWSLLRCIENFQPGIVFFYRQTSLTGYHFAPAVALVEFLQVCVASGGNLVRLLSKGGLQELFAGMPP